ncbi:MAG: hypothetical protein ACP5XB_31385, partial [Isosphaeraceae bacterium]
MHRRNMLAVLTLLFAAAPCFAQFGGGMGQGMGGMGGMGGGMMGGMGGMGMGRMRAFGAIVQPGARLVEVEMACGKKIEGELRLDAVQIETDMRQYQVYP